MNTSPLTHVQHLARASTRWLIGLSVAVLITGGVAIKADIDANNAAQSSADAASVAASAACAGSNAAKHAVLNFVDAIIARAQTPSPGETPEQIARRLASAIYYKQFREDAGKTLVHKRC